MGPVSQRLIGCFAACAWGAAAIAVLLWPDHLSGPAPGDRPPYATVAMMGRGYVDSDAAGALHTVLGAAMLRIRVFRDVPLALAAFFLVACSGALAARGVAYAGRFSMHLLGAGCALSVCAIAAAVKSRGSSRSSCPDRG